MAVVPRGDQPRQAENNTPRVQYSFGWFSHQKEIVFFRCGWEWGSLEVSTCIKNEATVEHTHNKQLQHASSNGTA